jgi:hypothetical protein
MSEYQYYEFIAIDEPLTPKQMGELRACSSRANITPTRKYWLLEWVLDENDNYERFAEEDGRGWMGRLAPLRDELLREDMRPLYLGWLAGVSVGEVSGKTTEPELPPGLSRLTAAQHGKRRALVRRLVEAGFWQNSSQ